MAVTFGDVLVTITLKFNRSTAYVKVWYDRDLGHMYLRSMVMIVH